MPRTTRTARAGSRSRWTPCWRGTCRSARSASCSGTTRCGSTAASRRRRASPLRLVPDRAAPRPSARLRSLLARNDRVLAVLGTPNAFHAQIMEAAGCEAAFVGTGITGGNYTAFADTGLLSATECVQFGGYIARAVSFPVILDGDTGHGGPPAGGPPLPHPIPPRPAGLPTPHQPDRGKPATPAPRRPG